MGGCAISFCRHNVHYKWSMFSFRECTTISVVLSFPQKVQYTYHMKYYSWQCASKCKQNSHRFSSTRGTWGKLNSLMRNKQCEEPSLLSILPYLRDYLDFIVCYMGFSLLFVLEHFCLTVWYVVLQSSAGWRITLHHLLQNLRCFLICAFTEKQDICSWSLCRLKTAR